MERTAHTRTTCLAAATAVALAGLLPLVAFAPGAHAGAIQRCQADDGSTVYTDRPCASLGAEALTMPGELTARLADAREAELAAGGTVDAGMAWPSAGAQPAVASARRSPAAGCARSPTQLAMDLQGAFALGDVNRIAESYHWVGMDHAAAVPVMERLERLGQSSVVDSRYYDASITSSGIGSWASADAAAVPSGSGIMQLTLGGEGGHHVVDLQVESYEGCYFVRF